METMLVVVEVKVSGRSQGICLLWLASFTQDDAVGFYPCLCNNLRFIPVYGWSMYIWILVIPFSGEGQSIFFFVWQFWKIVQWTLLYYCLYPCLGAEVWRGNVPLPQEGTCIWRLVFQLVVLLGKVVGPLGGGALLGKIHHWGRVFRLNAWFQVRISASLLPMHHEQQISCIYWLDSSPQCIGVGCPSVYLLLLFVGE